MLSPRITLEKLNKLATAWQDLAADKSFAGMTLAEYNTNVKPSLDARDAVQTAEAQMMDALNRRQTADVESLGITLLVVNSIKGDPSLGEDSSLYEAAGYVRKSERKSGLSRKAKTAVTPTKLS